MKIDKTNLPKHIAVIMDGNGRWAKKQGKLRVFGHQQGVVAVRTIIQACAELRIKYLTLYTFSTENWNRPALEVNSLMLLLSKSLKKELKAMHENNIRLNVIGNLEKFPSEVKKELVSAMEITKNNTGTTVTLALGYGSREELTQAVQKIATSVQKGEISVEEISFQTIENQLYTFGIPDVDLLIRTSGEQRISNFLLWQIAYAEFIFTPVLWPDFNQTHLLEAIAEYQNRERRFGKTSEQLT